MLGSLICYDNYYVIITNMWRGVHIENCLRFGHRCMRMYVPCVLLVHVHTCVHVRACVHTYMRMQIVCMYRCHGCACACVHV